MSKFSNIESEVKHTPEQIFLEQLSESLRDFTEEEANALHMFVERIDLNEFLSDPLSEKSQNAALQLQLKFGPEITPKILQMVQDLADKKGNIEYPEFKRFIDSEAKNRRAALMQEAQKIEEEKRRMEQTEGEIRGSDILDTK
jgi:hypothetical protein